MPDTKSRILSAAEALIAEKGIKNTTIAAIARKANVADSHAYQYFKGKEGLLFAVAEERFKESLDSFDEQIQGISESWSMLSKMIWYGLRYNDQHPGYVRILLFECRSNKNFYSTPAYRLMRKHSAILTDILTKGINEGIFSRDLNMNLLRDIIYGTFDFEAISRLAIKEIDESVTDLEDIMAILHPMIVKPKEKPESDKKERILAAAEAEFAMHGFSKTKVSKIAQNAEVSEGTVYEYFKNKEELLLAIPAKRFQSHIKAMPGIFEIKSPLRKLRRLMRYHFLLYLPNRDFLKIFLLDIQLNIRFYASPAFTDFKKYYESFELVIKEGQAEGSFRPDINPRVFRTMFLGAFNHMALRWVMLGNGEEIDKMKEIDQVIDLFATAVSNR